MKVVDSTSILCDYPSRIKHRATPSGAVIFIFARQDVYGVTLYSVCILPRCLDSQVLLIALHGAFIPWKGRRAGSPAQSNSAKLYVFAAICRDMFYTAS